MRRYLRCWRCWLSAAVDVLLLALIARGRFHGASIMSLLFCAWFPWRLFHLDVVEVRHHHRVLPPASTGRVS